MTLTLHLFLILFGCGGVVKAYIAFSLANAYAANHMTPLTQLATKDRRPRTWKYTCDCDYTYNAIL